MQKTIKWTLAGIGGVLLLLIIIGLASDDASNEASPAENGSHPEEQAQESDPYRNVEGFAFVQENNFDGYKIYDYTTNDEKYQIRLNENPQGGVLTELEEDYSLDESSQDIAGTTVSYAFSQEAVINGTKVAEAYEAASFVFERNGKEYIGFVNTADKTADKRGIETALRSFANALLKNL